jgi:ATP-binding protein involved in chromosome partitioning
LPLIEQSCFNVLKKVDIASELVRIELQIGYPLASEDHSQIESQIKAALNCSVNLQINIKIEPHIARSDIKAIPGIKNIIAVASGKGGVGKSTTAVNLAVALKNLSAKVGILDADVYGPNQPHLLGIKQKPELTAEKKFIPIEQWGMPSMSMGYLVDEDTPMVWRGPMISSALNQLLNGTKWGELDYLIVDMPPGTGDIQLTLSKKTPLSAVVMVTTPQDIALLDVTKAVGMFNKVKVPTLGVIENMGTHICSQCGHQDEIFSSGGGAKIAAKFDFPVLAQLPLNREIREASDAGKPLALNSENQIAKIYQRAAIHMAAMLSLQPKSYSQLFSNIKVEKG